MSLFSYLFLGIQFIILPWLSFQSRDLIETEDHEEVIPSRRALYFQSVVMLSLLGGLAALVDWKEGLIVQWFHPITGFYLLLALGLYGIGMFMNYIHFKYFEKESDIVTTDFILPQKSQEYLPWVLVCITAAWAEEYIYRGVLPGLLHHHGMLYILAVILSAVAFSFSHYTQGALAVVITFIFALGFQYLYHVSQSLLLPMLVHLFYNFSVEFLRRTLMKSTS